MAALAAVLVRVAVASPFRRGMISSLGRAVVLVRVAAAMIFFAGLGRGAVIFVRLAAAAGAHHHATLKKKR